MVGVWTGLLGAQTAVAANKARVELLPSVSAVAPGQSFDVGMKFSLDEGWHIYWKNPGDSGAAPKAKWNLPDGVEASPLQFPLPKRKLQSGIITTFVLSHEPVLITQISTPDSISGSKITLKADVQWLVCSKSQCLMEKQSAKVSIPVVANASEVKQANERVFATARKKFPVAAGKAKYVRITPSLSKGSFSPGSTFEVQLEVNIKPSFHIQSDKPLIAGLVATDVFMNLYETVFFDPPLYPEAEVRNMPGVGKLSEFGGKIAIRIPGETDTEMTGASVNVGGLFVYQACNEKGTCYAPEGVEWGFNVPIAGAAADNVPAEKLAAIGDGDETAPPTAVAATKPIEDEPVAPVEKTGEESLAKQAAVENEHATSTSTADAEAGGLEAYLTQFGTIGLLFGCFIYGLVVNATPCVLPLLSIKVMGFVQQAHQSRRHTLMLGLSFGAGVMIFWVVLGLLASRGTNILQFPAAVIALGAVVTALSLSMLGVYTLQAPQAASKLDQSMAQEGLGSSFGKGALAPVLGFACTGPMLAGAFAWATQQPPHIAILAFLMAGLGMALPYMVLGAFPNWLSFVPKPGNWMITFERIMGFMLLAMVIWLIHPLITLLGPAGLEWTLVFYVAIGMGCWILGKISPMMESPVRLRYRGTAAMIVLASGLTIYGYALEPDAGGMHVLPTYVAGPAEISSEEWAEHVPWRKWSPEAVREAVLAGNPVFVDFTAAYCTVCKVNKKRATNTLEVRAKMESMGVVPLQGDFSTGDDLVFEELQKHKRGGVPLNLIFAAGKPDHPIVLKPNLTRDYLLEKLDEANQTTLAAADRG